MGRNKLSGCIGEGQGEDDVADQGED